MKIIKWYKPPQPKKWYQLSVDGKILAVLDDSKQSQKERKRLFHLSGIEIMPATDAALIRFNCKTLIPSRILKKMDEAYKVKSYLDKQKEFAPGYRG